MMNEQELEMLKTIDNLLAMRSTLFGVHLYSTPPCVHQSALSRKFGLGTTKELLTRLSDAGFIEQHPDFDNAYYPSTAGEDYLVERNVLELWIEAGMTSHPINSAPFSLSAVIATAEGQLQPHYR